MNEITLSDDLVEITAEINIYKQQAKISLTNPIKGGMKMPTILQPVSPDLPVTIKNVELVNGQRVARKDAVIINVKVVSTQE